MKLFLTGRPGVGKTTVVKRVYSINPDSFAGFWTEETRENDRRTGFEIITTGGQRAPLAHIRFEGPHRVGKYGVDIRSFEEIVIPLLGDALHGGKRIILVDEIGKMELLSRKFLRLVERIIEAEVDVLATIPSKNIHPLVARIRREFPVVEVNIDNRDALPGEIARKFGITGS